MMRTKSSLVLAVVVALASASCVVVAQDEEPVYRCEAVDLTSASLEVQDVTIFEIQSDIDESGSAADTENCFPTNFPDTVIVRTSGIVTAVGRTNPPMFYMQDGTGTSSSLLSIRLPPQSFFSFSSSGDVCVMTYTSVHIHAHTHTHTQRERERDTVHIVTVYDCMMRETDADAPHGNALLFALM